MKDRVPVNPGRVLISPENGAAYYATMSRADNPTQEGTPLNKNSLLKDATAALFGLSADAVPDDVFAAAKALIDSANANANTKAKIATGSYTGTGTYGASNPCSLKFDFAPKVVFILYYSISGTMYGIGHDGIATGAMLDSALTTSWVKNVGFGLNTNSGGSYCDRYGRKLADGTFQWYSTGDANAQFNKSGNKYYYVAIG